jgi:N-carbamoyl-L-amino-acid hydrolase
LNQTISIDGKTLLTRIRELGEIGRDKDGVLSRVAVTDADKLGRDQFVSWLEQAGLDVRIDRIGNIFGIWNVESDIAPLMMGSHIDSVINAGILDGCYGVLSGLSVVEEMKTAGVEPDRSLIVGAFTNEEGARYAPDMMGSLVYAGGLDTDEALLTKGIDNSILGEELTRIGYAGDMEPGSITPSAFIEVHIEQGPVLETEGKTIGAVVDLQGISWQEVTIRGIANHAGTTQR